MALPETDLARIRRWCDEQVPRHLWEQLRIESDVADRHVTIVEVRPPWDGKGEHTRFPIARLRWTQVRREWSLLWRDRNLRFHEYDQLAPTPDVQIVLDFLATKRDPMFFG